MRKRRDGNSELSKITSLFLFVENIQKVLEMSLNPQLVPVALPANTNKGPVYFPLAYEGELILASRDQSNFTINGPRQYK